MINAGKNVNKLFQDGFDEKLDEFIDELGNLIQEGADTLASINYVETLPKPSRMELIMLSQGALPLLLKKFYEVFEKEKVASITTPNTKT